MVVTRVAVAVVGAITNGISWMNTGEAAKHPTTHDTKHISVQHVHSAKAEKPEKPKNTRWL